MLSETQVAFYDRSIELAQKHAPECGIDWRLLAAAALLESGWGESPHAREANNIFGLRATSKTPKDGVFVDTLPSGNVRFRRFKTEDEAFVAYAKILRQSETFQIATETARKISVELFVSGLPCFYCESDPDHATKLMQIVEFIVG